MANGVIRASQKAFAEFQSTERSACKRCLHTAARKVKTVFVEFKPMVVQKCEQRSHRVAIVSDLFSVRRGETE